MTCRLVDPGGGDRRLSRMSWKSLPKCIGERGILHVTIELRMLIAGGRPNMTTLIMKGMSRLYGARLFC